MSRCAVSICIVDDKDGIRHEAKVAELRDLLKIFGVRLASKVPHGAYHDTLRPLIRCGHLRCCQCWTPVRLYKTYLKLDNEAGLRRSAGGYPCPKPGSRWRKVSDRLGRNG